MREKLKRLSINSPYQKTERSARKVAESDTLCRPMQTVTPNNCAVKPFKEPSMTDKEQCQMLEDFANESSVAQGGHIKVTVGEHSTRFQPKDGYGSFKHEDSKFLDEILTGATHFMYWLRREGYVIRKAKLPNKGVK